jgi:hypothetical protein
MWHERPRRGGQLWALHNSNASPSNRFVPAVIHARVRWSGSRHRRRSAGRRRSARSHHTHAMPSVSATTPRTTLAARMWAPVVSPPVEACREPSPSHDLPHARGGAMSEPMRVGELLPGVVGEVVERAGHGYARWAELVAQAGYCHHPIRLAGRVDHADRQTGEVRQVYDSEREPDGVLLKACGTRRESRCPSCAATYRADAYQLLAAGLKGGRGVPETVAAHPRLFVTFTAPSFGRVHSRKAQGRLVLPCHPYRQGARCPHGNRAGCWHRHDQDDPRLGEPLCPSCYDAPGASPVERPGARAVAPDDHRHRACPGPAGRPPGGRAAAAGPDLLCQGGRVPTPGCRPLPRGHPSGRGHRLSLCWLPGLTTRAVHSGLARERPTAGRHGGPGAMPAPGGWRAGAVCRLG